MSKKYRSGSIRVEVADVIDAIGDEDLLDEVEDRGLLPPASVFSFEDTDLDMVREAYDCLTRGNVVEARTTLDRLLFPKWKNRENCKKQYETARS